MDFSGWHRSGLQDFCREHRLYAGGSKQELEDRINLALGEGSRVDVYHPARDVWRRGTVVCLMRPRKIVLLYDDNNKACVHDLEATVFALVGEDGEGGAASTTRARAALHEEDLSDDEEDWVTEGEEEEEEELDEEQLQDVPLALGMLSGTLVEVEWDADDGDETFWWSATLGKRLKGREDSEGRQMYWLSYDVMIDDGSAGIEKVKVSFVDRDQISDRGERLWRLMGATSSDEEESEEEEEAEEESEESESEEEGPRHAGGRHDVDGVTAGMSGLGLGSRRSPRTRALIVGCSYRGTSSELTGTLNDATDIHNLLVDHFRVPNFTDSVMMLTDDHSDRLLLPTRRNILKGFAWLMQDLQPGDSLFFYFSGHGGQQDDPTGQERRGNQTICPCDYTRAGVITDSEIHSLLVRPLPQSVTLHSLIDSCHSGTVMNLPYNALLKRGNFQGWEEEYPGQSMKKGTGGGLVIQFSAARHDQSAKEASMGKARRRSGASQQRGAATHAFTRAIRHHSGFWGTNILYSDLLEKMHDELRSGNFQDQEPQISASTQLDLNRSDIMLKI